MKITVLYFATLRQHRGLAEEIVETTATTADALYRDLKMLHALELDGAQLRFAVNESFCDASSSIKDGDTVAFMPPVSGG